MKAIIKITITTASIYILFGFFLMMAQESMPYFPSEQDFHNCPGFQDYEKAEHRGTRFYLKNISDEKVIIYYHGNAGSACDRSFTKKVFEKSGSSIIYVEYAGYSNDDKKPSKELIFRDVENIIDHVEKTGYKKTVVYGQSIGSGPASHHTNIKKADSLVLVSPFSKLKDIAKSRYPIYPGFIFFKENYDNIEMLKDYEGKTLIIHGENDDIIKPKYSKKLYNSIKNNNKEYILLEDRSHNDLWNSKKFRKKIEKSIAED